MEPAPENALGASARAETRRRSPTPPPEKIGMLSLMRDSFLVALGLRRVPGALPVPRRGQHVDALDRAGSRCH
ncbi:hypothetical protein [Streptomyces sp. GS7]|uniref:hypothetical protein n=1 Tax=Streptomyces sp. GS7 TaxID=2692234 RepID=UPI001315E0CC|nr:hypothetical protein [Streptomyces sp. GS7]QHC26197.1 hypothetical protein GR130_37315 [Streptomyces sp. GS7]